MLYIDKLLKDNKITIASLAIKIGCSRTFLYNEVVKINDFRIDHLEQIYNYLIENNIIDKNFDIGKLLSEI